MIIFDDTGIQRGTLVAMGESNIPFSAAVGEGIRFPIGPDVANHQVASTGVGSAVLRRVFSFPAMLACSLVGAVFEASRAFHVDPDLWWHIKVGQSILSTHHWPTTDIYSFTVSGQPWWAHEWLGDVLLAAVYDLGGVRGLAVLLTVLGSAVVLALYAYTTIRSGNSKAGFVASSVLCVLAMMSFSLRPQMLGYLFLILTLIVLERFRQGKPGTLWLLPLLMLVWVNAHGSWIMEPAIIFVYWMSGLLRFQVDGLEAHCWKADERLRISSVFLLCLMVLPITPYGTRIAVTPFEVAFSLPLTSKYIQEFQSMPFNIPGGKIFLALLLMTFLIQVTLRLKWRLEELALFLIGAMMACLHVRFVLVFVPFFAPILVTILSRWVPNYNPFNDKFALNAVLMTGIVAAIIHYFPSRRDIEQSVAKQFPVAAVAYMQQHAIPGPVFNNYGFGGYLVWSRGPEHKVFIDGRSDLYERGGLLADYMHISRLEPGAFAVMQGYGIRTCLLGRDEPLATALSASPAWERVYADDLSALFVRKDAAKSLTVAAR